jgi:acyl carrier protein
MSTQDTIRHFIVDELNWQGPRSNLTEDYPLIAEHVIDSLDMMKLVSLIESKYGFEIKDEELVPGNFSSIADMTRFIESKLDNH